jgi:hypothetical protein
MAKKSQSINVVTSDFSRAMREMSRITGFSFADIIRAETKSILEAAAKKTAAAQVKLIEQNAKERPFRWLGNKLYYMENRYPDALWAALQLQIKNSIKASKAARGLAKKSWMQIAEKLGIEISIPNYVAKATTKGGDYPANAKGSEKQEGNAFHIEISNYRTYTTTVADALRAAMRGRTNFFKKNLRLGVFQKTSELAAKYPGLKAT